MARLGARIGADAWQQTCSQGANESSDLTGLWWEVDDAVRAILADRAAAGPTDGSFAYSDAGSHLLSAVLTRATAQSVLEFARANVFDPLGIPSQPAFEPVFGVGGRFRPIGAMADTERHAAVGQAG